MNIPKAWTWETSPQMATWRKYNEKRNGSQVSGIWLGEEEEAQEGQDWGRTVRTVYQVLRFPPVTRQFELGIQNQTYQTAQKSETVKKMYCVL